MVEENVMHEQQCFLVKHTLWRF